MELSQKEDDDADGMHDEDEIMLWPTRFARNSTNPWDPVSYTHLTLPTNREV